MGALRDIRQRPLCTRPRRPPHLLACEHSAELAADAKVGELHHSAAAEQHVVRLQVAVQHAMGVQVLHRQHNLRRGVRWGDWGGLGWVRG